MTVNKRKKVVKYRAHTTHGGGHRKKRRGAGNRGGRGRAGRGKKGKAKKQMYEKMGQHGFFSLIKNRKFKVINLNRLGVMLQNKKIVEKEGVVDLGAYGYHKLLGTGELKQKVKIKVARFSKQAEEKVKAAGGSIVSVSASKKEAKEK